MISHGLRRVNSAFLWQRAILDVAFLNAEIAMTVQDDSRTERLTEDYNIKLEQLRIIRVQTKIVIFCN